MGNRINASERKRVPVTRTDSDKREKIRPLKTNKPRSKRRQKETMKSCPDLLRTNSTTQCSKNNDDERQFEFKIYRSFSDLHESKRFSCAEMPPLEVKVYRRSTERLASTSRTQSLPRGIERMSAPDGIGSLALSQDLSTSSCYPSQAPSSCSGNVGGPDMTSSVKSSRRTSARSSLASTSTYKVFPKELPDSATIRRKLAEFETYFVNSLVETFECLPPLNQLSILSVATRPDRANQSLSLLQYFESDSIPADLRILAPDSRREYFLTVSPTVFTSAMSIKSSGHDAQRLIVAKDIVTEMARQAAGELCRMFEYQISLILESVALRLLAIYAAECVFDFVKRRHRLLDRNTIAQGVIRGTPGDGSLRQNGRKLISVIIGAMELKWYLCDIFKKPGLRKDLFAYHHLPVSVNDSRSGPGLKSRNELHESQDESRLSSREDHRISPWRYYESTHSDPMLYGYRGQLIEWDFVNGHYRINHDDEISFGEEISPRYNDFHRLYCPYFWLIGLDTVQGYITATKGESTSANDTPSLVEFVKQSRVGVVCIRDDIKLVYKPLCSDRTTAESVADVIAQSSGDRALVSDTAMQVTKECGELVGKLNNIGDLKTGFTEECRGSNNDNNDNNDYNEYLKCGNTRIYVKRTERQSKQDAIGNKVKVTPVVSTVIS